MNNIPFFRLIFFCFALMGIFFTAVRPVLADEVNENASPGAMEQQLDTTFSERPLSPPAPPAYSRGKVVLILDEKEVEIDGQKTFTQRVQVKLLSGDEKGTTVTLDHGGEYIIKGQQKVRKGERVVVASAENGGKQEYFIIDQYRLPALLWIFLAFVALAVYFGGKRGITSLIGLVISIFILGKYIVPNIVSGTNPFLVGLVGAVIIALIALYVAHGFNKRTTIALASTLITIGLAALLSIAFVTFAKLFGTGSEDALYAQTGMLQNLDLRGLLLAGILIGTLGVLDDVTTGQTAAVEEIQKANGTLSMRELYARGLSVGREHIASLVNTLALAYAGASLPLFLLFATNQTQPLWVIGNSEAIADEVVRTLVGSSALILAVPIATILAAYFFRAQSKSAAPVHNEKNNA